VSSTIYRLPLNIPLLLLSVIDKNFPFAEINQAAAGLTISLSRAGKILNSFQKRDYYILFIAFCQQIRRS